MSSFFVNALRTEDFVHIQFEFINLSLDAANPAAPQLRKAAAGPAFVVVRFPPQHVAEESPRNRFDRDLPYKGFLACPSRIAFRLPEPAAPVAFRLDALLELISQLEPVTSDAPPSGEPTSVIEFPDRLLLVPRASLRLFHRTAPVSSPATRHTELWHTRLGNGPEGTGRFRAIKNSVDVASAERPIETTLTRENRDVIVARSSPDLANPHVITSSQFMMTALGASARLRSDWPDDGDPSLAGWDHDTEIGRDFYVRTVERGFLFPFGHRATITTTTEREFRSHFPVNVAELVQEKILTIQEAEKNYKDLKDAYEFGGREMPFQLVRIAAAPRTVNSNDDPIRVDTVMVDGSGNLVDCSLTVFFVPLERAGDEAAIRQTRDEAFEAHSSVSIANQRVSVAEDENGRGDATLNVERLKFGVKSISEMRRSAHPPFLPFVEGADVKIPALEHLLGGVAGRSGPAGLRTTAITLHEKYLRSGFQEDKKQVFAKFAPIPGISIPAERAGGLAAPQFPDFDGLSKVMGPVTAVDRFVRDEEISAAILIGETKLLGVISLKDIIADAGAGADDFSVGQIAKLFELVENEDVGEVFITRPITTTIKHPSGIETRFLWKPKIKTGGFPPPLESNPPGKLALILKGRINKSIKSASSPPAFEVEGKLKNFQLKFHNLLTVKFRKVEFKSGAAKKVDVKIDLAGVEFGAALSFVKKLQELLPIKSLGGAPTIDPQPDGVVVRYGIPIPSAPLGVLSIQNIALSSSLSLPFVEGRPAAVRFALSEPNNPFLVTVSIFGGTGFFAVEVRTDGSLRVDAAIEFGGIISLNLFVIKGGVYLLAGVFLSMESGGKLLITGHLRFGGYVDVLEIVSVSIELYIALTYDSGRNVLQGTGRVTVSVKLIFFSESFSFEVDKEIAGFGEAPVETAALTFRTVSLVSRSAAKRNVMNKSQWQKYCAAFV